MPDSTSQIHIANAALYRLGQSPITSFSEGTEAANVVNELYGDTRDKLLTWQPWSWATVRQKLARLSITPPSDFAFYYALPTQPFCLRVIDLDLDNQGVDYQREVAIQLNTDGSVSEFAAIATDATAVVLRYIGRVSEGLYPPLFTDTLSLWLAFEISQTITGKPSLRTSLGQELTLQLNKLSDVAGHEDSPRVIPQATTYLDVRE